MATAPQRITELRVRVRPDTAQAAERRLAASAWLPAAKPSSHQGRWTHGLVIGLALSAAMWAGIAYVIL